MLTRLRSRASSVPPTASSPTASTPSAPPESTPTTLFPSASVLTQSPLPSLPPSMMTEVSGPPPPRRRQHRPISQSPVMPSSIPAVLPPLHSPSLAPEPSPPLVQPGPVFSSPATTTLATVTAPRERGSSSGLGTIRDSSGLPQAKRPRTAPANSPLQAILETIRATVQSEVASAVANLPQTQPSPPPTQLADTITSGMIQ